jgi:hypothetical protein
MKLNPDYYADTGKLDAIEQLDDLLAGAAVALSDEVLDRIDAILAPGTEVGTLHAPYTPSALPKPASVDIRWSSDQPHEMPIARLLSTLKRPS